MSFRIFGGLLTAAMMGCAAIASTQTTTTVAADSPSTPSAAPTGDLKPLKLDLPKPVFVGTPKNLKVENLEVPGKSREPFLAPHDVTNLAEGKEITVSDSEPVIGEAELLTDGDKEAADGSYVEFGPGVQWAQIDLGKKSELFAIVLWHYHQQARVYHDVVVKVAADADFISNVQTVFNNDHDNSAKLGVGTDKSYIETNEGKLIDCKGVTGRYVRMYSKGNTANEMNHYIEAEVYGRAAK